MEDLIFFIYLAVVVENLLVDCMNYASTSIVRIDKLCFVDGRCVESKMLLPYYN